LINPACLDLIPKFAANEVEHWANKAIGESRFETNPAEMTCLAASYLGSGLALASARQEPSSFKDKICGAVQWAALVPRPVVAWDRPVLLFLLFLLVLAKLAKSHISGMN
jgi:hypothetical protein